MKLKNMDYNAITYNDSWRNDALATRGANFCPFGLAARAFGLERVAYGLGYDFYEASNGYFDRMVPNAYAGINGENWYADKYPNAVLHGQQSNRDNQYLAYIVSNGEYINLYPWQIDIMQVAP
jgi:hypothetical protein